MICLVMLIGCSTQPRPVHDPAFIGMDMHQAMSDAELALTRGSVIYEPPGVPRGIQGHDGSGDLVELYVRRGDVPFSENMDSSVEQFRSKSVVGVAREQKGRWTIAGDVMLVRRMGATQLATKPSEQASDAKRD
jgi:hypothetical protein